MSLKKSKRSYTLDANNELWFEATKTLFSLKLIEGEAEIYGQEIIKLLKYEFKNVRMSVFTYVGAKIEVEGESVIEYVSEDSFRHFYLNLHVAMHNLRKKAEEEGKAGPRILIFGDRDNQLAQTLINYSLRQQCSLFMVDIDPSHGYLIFPGVIGAMKIDKLIECTQGIKIRDPYCHFFGFTKIKESPAYYEILVSKIAEVLNSRMNADKYENAMGMIVQIPKLKDKQIGLVEEIIKMFKISHVLVVNNEGFQKMLERNIKDMNLSTEVCRVLMKSVRDEEMCSDARFDMQNKRIQNYFQGTENEFQPLPVRYRFDEFGIRSISDALAIPSTVVPFNEQKKKQKIKIYTHKLSQELVHSIIAVSQAPGKDETDLATYPVKAFFKILEVDINKNRIDVLSPRREKVQMFFFLLGKIKWTE